MSACPKVFAGEIALSATKRPGYLNGTFPLDVSDHIRHRILRRNTQTHMHVIPHQVPFDDLRFLVPR